MISNRLTIFSISFVLFALIGIIALPQPTLAEGPIILSDISNNSENNFVPGQIIVGLKNGPSSVESDIKFKGGKILEANDKLNALLVKVPNKAEDAFLEAMKNNPNVTFVVKNHVVTKSAIIPNDPYWGDQWNMKIIKAHEAWSTQLGSTDVTVAVIDTGIDDTHSDLIGRVVQGYDFAYDDNDPMDGDGHGTHVAGTIGATTNNGIGVAGLAQVNILPVKVLDDNGSGSDWSVSQGIIFAESRSDIINLSLGCACTENDLPLTKLALASAYSKNVLIVAAAGNSASSGPHYPSDDSNVISVSATTKDDKLASYSNYGNSIELSAPGGDTKGGPYWKTYVLSTYNENGYAYSIGTSMASPHVAGVAALVLSQYPNLSNTELRTHLQNTADDLGSAGLDTLYGYGRVNAQTAVTTIPVNDNTSPVITSISVDASSTTATITWTTDEPATSVVDYGGTADTYDSSVFDIIYVTSHSIELSGLSHSNTYHFMITSLDSSNNSASSSDAQFTTASPPTLKSITISPDNTSITEGSTQQFIATGAYSDGPNQVLTDVTWTSSDSNIATIDANGLASGISVGPTMITANSGGFSDTASLYVTAALDEPTTVSVSLITYGSEGGKNKDKHLLVTITLIDDLSNFVSGASVSIDLSRDDLVIASGTATTSTDGTVTFSLKNAPSGHYETDVTNVVSGLDFVDGYIDDGYDK